MLKIYCDVCGKELSSREDGWLKINIEHEGTWYVGAGDDVIIPRTMHIHRKCWPFPGKSESKETQS